MRMCNLEVIVNAHNDLVARVKALEDEVAVLKKAIANNHTTIVHNEFYPNETPASRFNIAWTSGDILSGDGRTKSE